MKYCKAFPLHFSAEQRKQNHTSIRHLRPGLGTYAMDSLFTATLGVDRGRQKLCLAPFQSRALSVRLHRTVAPRFETNCSSCAPQDGHGAHDSLPRRPRLAPSAGNVRDIRPVSAPPIALAPTECRRRSPFCRACSLQTFCVPGSGTTLNVLGESRRPRDATISIRTREEYNLNNVRIS